MSSTDNTQTRNAQGKLHSFDDLPAKVTNNGRRREWYKDGKLHREGGAAIISVSAAGDRVKYKYFLNGVCTREDGPAEVITHITKPSSKVVVFREVWYKDGVIHRDGGPALTDRQRGGKSTTYVYYNHGKVSRHDGPASTCREAVEGGEIRITELWMIDGVLTREDGPAKVVIQGQHSHEIWYYQGLVHRSNGPAVTIISPIDGSPESFEHRVSWYKMGKRHCADGPAIVVMMNMPGNLLIVDQQWYEEGVRHRDAGPAVVEYLAGQPFKCKHYHRGVLHRLDGPAVENLKNPSINEWWWRGRLIETFDEWCAVSDCMRSFQSAEWLSQTMQAFGLRQRILEAERDLREAEAAYTAASQRLAELTREASNV